MAEAYPDMLTGLMHYRTMIEDLVEVVGHIKAWIGAEVEKRNAITVNHLLQSSVDQVAAKDDKVFEGLKNPETRAAFIVWLRKEVDPKVGALTAENMEKFWLAYNATGLLNFAKEAAQKVAAPPSPTRKRAAGDGSSSRAGAPETPKEKSLLERMTEDRLGPEA